jgi:signal transduction histidine kinase
METKGCILVIDDEQGIQRGCRRALEPQGFSVDVAATFQEGLRKIREGTFDLVLLDVMLPDGKGIDLLAPIREKDPDLVCVIVTGYATVELATEAIKRGAYDFISKPFNADVLLMTVEQGLERRRLSQETKRLQAIEREAAELARAKAEMERQDQFKTTFMLTVTHELRSPVTSAQSLLRTLIRGLAGGLNDQQRGILTRIETRLDELAELVDDLLVLAAAKTCAPDQPLQPVTVQPILQRVLDRIAAEAENKGIAMMCRLPDQSVVVWATIDGLDRVLGNLIDNAIKYTPTGGSVRIEVIEKRDQVEITVSDTGIGIPEDALPHVWDEFFRARNVREAGITGTGLGLTIVQQLVNRFGGQIEVHSVVGKGATFTLALRPIQNVRSEPT